AADGLTAVAIQFPYHQPAPVTLLGLDQLFTVPAVNLLPLLLRYHDPDLTQRLDGEVQISDLPGLHLPACYFPPHRVPSFSERLRLLVNLVLFLFEHADHRPTQLLHRAQPRPFGIPGI